MLTNKELTRSWLFKILAKLESFDDIGDSEMKDSGETTTLIIHWEKTPND